MWVISWWWYGEVKELTPLKTCWMTVTPVTLLHLDFHIQFQISAPSSHNFLSSWICLRLLCLSWWKWAASGSSAKASTTTWKHASSKSTPTPLTHSEIRKTGSWWIGCWFASYGQDRLRWTNLDSRAWTCGRNNFLAGGVKVAVEPDVKTGCINNANVNTIVCIMVSRVWWGIGEGISTGIVRIAIGYHVKCVCCWAAVECQCTGKISSEGITSSDVWGCWHCSGNGCQCGSEKESVFHDDRCMRSKTWSSLELEASEDVAHVNLYILRVQIKETLSPYTKFYIRY